MTAPKTPVVPMLLDTAELAKHLKVSERYVRRLVTERRIPFKKWGLYVRFDPVEVTKWLDSATVEGRVEPRRYW